MAEAIAIRDRIKEFRRVPSAELEENDKNWRKHPYSQTKAMAEILDTVGIADVLIAYESERNGGKLTLIDGHERKLNHEADWPTVILDVNDQEADMLLLTMDPLTGLAETDPQKLAQLLADSTADGPGLVDLLQTLTAQARAGAESAGTSLEDMLAPDKEHPRGQGPPEMELQPFESYDYVVLLFKSSLDWLQAQDQLGMEKVAFTLKDGEKRKVGRGRVFDGAKFLAGFEKKK